MKGNKWRYYGLVLGVLLFSLLSTFFTEKVNAREFNSGWLTCGTDQDVTIYSSDGNKTFKCGSRTNLFSYSGNNLWFNRVRFQLAPINANTPWPQKVDSDIYSIISFTLEFAATNATILPTGFVGRNGIAITEIELEYMPHQSGTIGPSFNCTDSVGISGSDCHTLSNSSQRITYIMKIRIPAQEAWDGTIDLTTNMNIIGNNFTYYYGISQMRASIYTPDEIAAQKQEEQDRDNLQNQSDQTNSDAGSSEQQFQSGTTNLIGAVTSFANAMRNASTGSCKLPEISAYGMSLGELDLCTYSPPNWVRGLTSTILSLITVGLAWHVFKRIMGIAKGIAGKG